jgi:spore coat protein U-like protein
MRACTLLSAGPTFLISRYRNHTVVRIDELKQALHMNTRTTRKQTPLRLALAALAVLSGHAGAATATATASATVIAPIVITKGTDLAFGSFSSGTGGTVTISTSGVRSASGVALAPQGATPAAASFVVTGEQGAGYSITHSGTTTLTRDAGSETMVLTKFSDLTASNATAGTASSGTLAGGTQSIHVGGTLAVAPNQAPGSYSGAVSVMVEYN